MSKLPGLQQPWVVAKEDFTAHAKWCVVREDTSPCAQAILVLALDGAWAAYDFIQEQIHKGAAGP